MRVLGLALIAAAAAPGVAWATQPGANGRIVFARTPPGNVAAASDLYTVNPDGSGVARLTANGGAINPAWSPDGRRIAFELRSAGAATIDLIDADGTHDTPLVHGFGPPAWSPDGSRIAFTSDRDGNDEIYVMNADGSGLTNLTQNTGLDHAPAWSPDGARIAFGTIRSATFDTEIYTMNADGSAQTDLTNNPSASDIAPPSWSPDGSKVAYSVYRDGIYVIGAGGGQPTRLTTNPLGDIDPAWSPDGRQIVFSRQYDGNCTSPPTPTVGGQCRLLWIMNADGTGQRQLTDNPGGGDSDPSWGTVPPRSEPPEDVIGRTPAATRVSAFGGRAAWSVFDPATKLYSLVTWTEGLSSPQPTRVKPRRVPFDVDLGPNSRDAVVAVYSRCRHEPSGGCDLYVYDFGSRRESRIRSTTVRGGSEFLPTIWRSRIAFARVWEKRKRKVSYIYTRRLTRRDRSQRLAGGSSGTPTSLDLRGSRLALTWGFVQLDTLRGKPKRIARTAGARSASLAADGLYWVEGNTIRRYSLRSGAITAAPAPDSTLSAVRDGGTTFYSRAAADTFLVARYRPSFQPAANYGLASVQQTVSGSTLQP
ncbi:MAG TPA: hypothetical protein VN606_03190 [Thermoleophilaceae bacterium]|nr:hypothetical protein [Thermoleophilaceae bacterium]